MNPDTAGAETLSEEPAFDFDLDEQSDGTLLLALRGELDLRSAPVLRTVLHQALSEPGGRVTLDLDGLAYADSVGLSLFVAGHQRASSEGGRLRLRGAHGPVLRILQVSGLLDVLDLYDTADTADTASGGTTATPSADLPDHLMVWLRGRPACLEPRAGDGDGSPGDSAEATDSDAGAEEADDFVLLDDEIREGFSLPTWLAGVHDGYPDAVTAVVHGAGPDHGERVVQAVLGREERRFRGDTTPTSLRDLREWVRQAARDVGVEDDELLERVVLVASELAANVEKHAPGWLLVDIAPVEGASLGASGDGAGAGPVSGDASEAAGSFLVAVTDSRPIVLPRGDDAGAEGWRGGMDVVRAASDSFGLVCCPSTKTVWATLSRAA